MLQRLFGRLVLLVVIILGLWFVISHYHSGSKFGYDMSPGATAHADNADCPASIGAADNVSSGGIIGDRTDDHPQGGAGRRR